MSCMEEGASHTRICRCACLCGTVGILTKIGGSNFRIGYIRREGEGSNDCTMSMGTLPGPDPSRLGDPRFVKKARRFLNT